MDNAEYWTTLDIWAKVLHNVQVVVSTPAILTQALNHGFVQLQGISLLVFDEAHHCVGNAPMNGIMRDHYHPNNMPNSNRTLPSILGLSASPITKRRAEEVAQLEKNLNATCKTPLQQLEEYTDFVNMPEFVTLAPVPIPCQRLKVLDILEFIVSGIDIHKDPQTIALRDSDSRHAKAKLQDFLKKQSTPALKDMKSLLRFCLDIQENLGNWACEMFLKACIEKTQANVARGLDFVASEVSAINKNIFIASQLQPLYENVQLPTSDLSAVDSVSAKVTALLEFLQKSYRPELRCLIFVKTRPTAWSLADVVNRHPLTEDRYQAFSFVGVSNPSHQEVFDFADLRIQHDNLESFRRGELNICVATSVLEEGIDVPAMNLVICFDEPQNFRSFVQSRGRARQKESQFVIFPVTADKLSKWQTLEGEMREECQKSLDAIEERQNTENIEEEDGEVFRIASTGALLTFSEARQHLDRFCSKLPKSDSSEPQSPIFVMEGDPGIQIGARVCLPTSLSPTLQTAQSRRMWRTEKRAKQDAAFQAYLALYHAGLVTEYLLPLELPKRNNASNEADDIEKRDSFYEVDKQHDPCRRVISLWKSSDAIFAHRLLVEGDGISYPSMLVLLPLRLSAFVFDLSISQSSRAKVTIYAGVEMSHNSVSTAQEVTLLLLSTILGRRLRGLRKEQLPFLLVPDINQASLQSWHEAAVTIQPLKDVDQERLIAGQAYLVHRKAENVPYLWHPFGGGISDETTPLEGNDHARCINATRISRKLNYLRSDQSPASAWKEVDAIPVDECSLLGLPGEYCRLVTLIPSITYMLEVALRSDTALQGPLAPLGLRDLNLFSQALTAPSVCTRNYERLEFFGDSLLKFYATFQVFVDQPDFPSYQLTRNRSQVINNARLQRATRTLGLDQYLTRSPFAAKEWSAKAEYLTSTTKKHAAKALSSKTLADIVEAIIGAASLCGVDKGHSENNVLSALKLFLSEVPWRSLSDNLGLVRAPEQPEGLGLDILSPVEAMIGYNFRNHALLAEALTQSSLAGAGRSTYDRLEFLGDAVLDFIVAPQLFYSELELGPGEMTTRRAALVSHQLLAFFAMQISYRRTSFEVQTDSRTRKSVDEETPETIHLPSFIRRVGGPQISLEYGTTLSTFLEVQASILESLTSSKTFPWITLSRIGAPKAYSDIMESILAAIFIDSKGIDACETFLEKIGYMSFVRRFVEERDIEASHPEGILREVIAGTRHAGTQQSLEFVTQERRKRGTSTKTWRCRVVLDERVVAQVKNATCRDEARYRAATKAIEVFRRETEKEKQVEETDQVSEKPSKKRKAVDAEEQRERQDEDEDEEEELEELPTHGEGREIELLKPV